MTERRLHIKCISLKLLKTAVLTMSVTITFFSVLIILHHQRRLGSAPISDSSITLQEQVQSVFNKISESISPEINCHQIIKGEKTEIGKALKLMKTSSIPNDYHADSFYSNLKCSELTYDFISTVPSNNHGQEISIAFAIVVYKDFYQVRKLLKAIYRPQHFYCLHVDAKSSFEFYKAVKALADCHDNVALTDKRISVVWSTISILDAQLECFKKLLSMSQRWKYLINLTGQEYPLRTMGELEEILRSLNGSNNVEKLFTINEKQPFEGTDLHRLKFYKGSLFVTLVRGFVEFIFKDARPAKILEYLRQATNRPIFPDETFFSTLNHNPDILKVPGSYNGKRFRDSDHYPFLNKYVNWNASTCQSKHRVRNVCIFGVEDLKALNERKEFFANKFYYSFQPLALQCMEYRLWRNTLADYSQEVVKTHYVPMSYYSSLEYNKEHL